MAKRPLSKKALAYLDWLCLPEPLRIPATKKEWAEQNDVGSYNTLFLWQEHPDFKERWEDAVKKQAQSPERTEHLLDSLYQRGINGDTRSAELYLKATNQMPNPKQEINIKSEKTSELSDDELRALIAEYSQAEEHRRKTQKEPD
jgi:hypothetical protein